ncbi:MAG: peptide deformylase [Dissulfurispiraceae bacterium]|jgi:peptide deformylase|nr:peptide deformylase [Dissulfurispiraceae bacterium]
MAILEIKKYPADVLKQKSLPVEKVDSNIQKLIDDMIETMYAAPGIGLAAPQVGVSKRIIVVDINSLEEESEPVVLVNPEITDTDGLIESEEGCLSVPECLATIKRAETVVIKGLDRDGKEVSIKADGLFARALQHEIDHLNGVIILDRLSQLKRDLYRKKISKKMARVQR